MSTTEKILLNRGRTAVHFVKPRRGTKKYFECFYLIPTVLTYTLNTYDSGERYLFTRYTGVHFLWWAVEVSVKYGEARSIMEHHDTHSTVKEAFQNLAKAVSAVGAEIRSDFSRRIDHECEFINDLINNAQ